VPLGNDTPANDTLSSSAIQDSGNGVGGYVGLPPGPAEPLVKEMQYAVEWDVALEERGRRHYLGQVPMSPLSDFFHCYDPAVIIIKHTIVKCNTKKGATACAEESEESTDIWVQHLSGSSRDRK
jgi:hypothetical protein